MVQVLQPESRRYTYADLADFPDDRYRREIIDGEIFVTASPVPRHQRAAGRIFVRLDAYRQDRGGEACFAPLDVFFADDNVVEPDVLFIRADHLEQVGDRYVSNAPDLVVEVSSPSTRRLELVRKRELHERFGVPEYWYVDLEAERVEQYLLSEGRYPPPKILYPDQVLESAQLTGFSMTVGEALAADDPKRDDEAD